MRSKLLVRCLIVLALAAGLLPTGAAQTQTVAAQDYEPGELLVKFHPDAPAKTIGQFRELAGAQYDRTITGSAIEIWQVPVGSEVAASQLLAGLPGVIFAEPNYRIYAFDTVPNDPNYSKQWAYPKIGSPAAWDLTTGSTSITIAILDTGIDLNHPDLASKIVAGYDFVDNDPSPLDENGHGTHVAGIAAAVTHNSAGVAGTSWGARLMPVRILDETGSGKIDYLIAGIVWATSHGAQIINFSLGGTTYSLAMQDAINTAHNAGLLFVAAMGNGYDDDPLYPARLDNVLAVAATDRFDLRADYSSYGDHCDLAAPGGELDYYHDPDGIYSTMPTYPVYLTTHESYSQNYDYQAGTSMATPFVSGLAALIWSRNPLLTPDDVQQIMETTAVDLGTAGKDSYYGWGRIDAAAAVSAAVPDLHAIANPDGDGNYLVEWGGVAQATSYTLQEDDDPGFSLPKVVYQGAGTQTNLSGRSPGYWYYRVRAENAVGISDWSRTRAAGVLPGIPGLQSTPGALPDEYLLSWSQVAGADAYLLQESQQITFSLPTTRYLGPSLSYAVTGQPGGEWFYRLAAVNEVGTGPWSTSVISTVVPAPALLSPVLDPITNPNGNESFTLQWSEVQAGSYILEASLDMYFSDPTPVYSGTLRTFQMQAGTGGDWFFRVRAIGDAGRSAWSLPQATFVYHRIRLPLITKTGP